MLFIGTSSYSFKEWVGPFYPPKTPASRFLAYYSSRLNTVEINHTYRRFPTEKLSASWAAATPESFAFSLKMHQSISHFRRLENVEEPLEDYLRNVKPLGPRLGVVLIQLPPDFPVDLGRLEGVLGRLPPGQRFAFEFRHPSWDAPEVTSRLRKSGVAVCLAENDITENPPPATASYSYVRIRKVPPYSADEMALLRRKIQGALKQSMDVYFYIKHDETGLAPLVALQLQKTKYS